MYDLFITTWTCVGVSAIVVVCSLCVFLTIRLLVLCIGELFVECVCNLCG